MGAQNQYSCPFCNKLIYLQRMGAHMFKHDVEMRKALTVITQCPQGTVTVPFMVLGFQVCIVTYRVWKASMSPTAPAKKHVNQPEYNKEKQYYALYQYLGLAPPEKQLVLVTDSRVKPCKEEIEAQAKRETAKLIEEGEWNKKKPANEVIQEHVSISSEESIPKPAPKSKKPKCVASKKEIEKGMFCVRCEECYTFAAHKEDLKPCCNCKKLSHFNDDLTNCWQWECTTCNKGCCYTCMKNAKSDKRKPYCSEACKKAAQPPPPMEKYISPRNLPICNK